MHGGTGIGIHDGGEWQLRSGLESLERQNGLGSSRIVQKGREKKEGAQESASDRFSSVALVTRGWLAPEFGESQIVSEDRGCRQNSRQTTDQRSRNVDACVGEELL